MFFKNHLQFFFLIVLVGALLPIASVYAAPNIDPVDKFAFSETFGYMDFNPPGGGVLVENNKLVGYAFAEGFGWISMNCDQTDFDGTNTCAAQGGVDYGVTNDSNGALAGYAWSETLGYISFNCDQSSTGGVKNCLAEGGVDYWVNINTASGDFYGYAYGESVGWVSFNCDQTAYTGAGGGVKNCAVDGGQDYKVKTTWVGVSVPTNIRHTANTASSLSWAWDQMLNHTFEVQVWDGADFVNASPVTSAAETYLLSVGSDGATPLAANTPYTIRVRAVEDLSGNTGNYSSGVAAATSANAPINLTGTPVVGSDGTEIDWGWASGGAQTQFYAQVQEDPLKNSGLTTDMTWRATGLTCNTLYTLQVLATNQKRNACFADNGCPAAPGSACPGCTGDETAWQTTQVTSGLCPVPCTVATDCPNPTDICVAGFCRPPDQCIPPGASCNEIFNSVPTDGICAADGTCDTKPFAEITIVQNGTTDDPSQFNASTSQDDITTPADLLARWDFDYQVGQPGEPNWSLTPNLDYPSGKKAIDSISYQYPAAGAYTVAAQVRDSAGQDSDIDTVTININGGTIVLNPDRSPTTNPLDVYTFGLVPPNKTVDILVTICNLGEADLTINGYSLQNEMYNAAPFDMNPDAFLFKDATGAGPFIAPLTLADDPALAGIPLGSRVCNPNIDPFSRQDAKIRFYVPPGTLEGTYSAKLVISSNDPVTPNKELSFSVIVKNSPVGSEGSESIKFDSRTIANPPPTFVEFLEQLQFKEEQKTK